jgi:hypothetical protein
MGGGVSPPADLCDISKARDVALLPVASKTRFQRDGRRWPEGPDEGVFVERQLPPHQLGRMTYGRASSAVLSFTCSARAHKSWPRVLSPRGRGVLGISQRSPSGSDTLDDMGLVGA